jgi:ribose 5-phosphate isomerase B
MKRFSLITEADARVLEPGQTVALERHGHVTPLAADTLRDRRIVVVREDGADVDVAALAPPSPVRVVAIGSDHSGVALKRGLVEHLRRRGLRVIDTGTDSTEPVDYPDTAAAVAVTVARREADAGVVIDGAGLGSAMAANKVAGVRAALCTSTTLATYARQHNGANVLSLGATLIGIDEARAIVDTFLETAMTEPRYVRRLAKMAALERQRRDAMDRP